MSGQATLERRLRMSGVLIVLGLIVEALSLGWIHPLAFMGFMIVGGALLIAGVAVYLLSLVTGPPTAPGEAKH